MAFTEDQSIAFIGKDAEFEGVMESCGIVTIDGRFKGKISSKGTIIVGVEGKIESDIHVADIVIFGEIHGNIIAENKIDVRASGKVFGDIESPTIMIERGSIIKGNCKTHQMQMHIQPTHEPI